MQNHSTCWAAGGSVCLLLKSVMPAVKSLQKFSVGFFFFFFFATFVTGLKTSTVADICPVSQSTSLQPNLLMTESVSGLVQAVDAIKVHTLILDQRQED